MNAAKTLPAKKGQRRYLLLESNSVLDRADKIAKTQGCTLADVIRKALREYVSREERPA